MHNKLCFENKRFVEYRILKVSNNSLFERWIYLETYEVTQGGAKFMHITTPEAAAQIVTDQLIKASGALNDANVQRFGKATKVP